MNDLYKYSKLAQNILSQQSRYKSNKEIIKSVFKMEHEDKIMFRLTIIDSYYSTQMNKRLYGLEDIAIALKKFSDDELKIELYLFLNTKNNKIKTLFEESYGFNKLGENKKKAISLLSKYFYFLLDYQFPIYDSLCLISYKTLLRNNLILNEHKMINESNYFEKMISLNKNSQIYDFDKLDNFLWLLGKIKKGSFSILMDKKKYESIVKEVIFKNKENSKNIDYKIREFIKKNYSNFNFSQNEKEFFGFAFSLK